MIHFQIGAFFSISLLMLGVSVYRWMTFSSNMLCSPVKAEHFRRAFQFGIKLKRFFFFFGKKLLIMFVFKRLAFLKMDFKKGKTFPATVIPVLEQIPYITRVKK